MAGHVAQASKPSPSDDEALRALVDELKSALDEGDETGVASAVDRITRIRETTLFNEMGHITRQLHEALVGLQLDPQISALTENDIPDAKVRLDYVLSKTEDAAHRTLTAVEGALPLASQIQGRAGELGDRWQRFQRRELSPEEFRELAREVDAFFTDLRRDSAAIGERLSEVLMAQDFQDLTGQVIRRVMELVQEVQDHLVALMRTRGGAATPAPRAQGTGTHAEGPQVVAVPAANVVQSQDDVDDLLSSLGF